MRNLLRKLRGAFGNAAVWGLSWFGASFVILSTLMLLGVTPAWVSWGTIAGVAANVGGTGFLAGGCFAAFLSLVYRNRRLEDIRATRAALGGAVVAGIISPLISAAVIGIGGFGIPLGFLLANAGWAALFGALTAGGTIKVSQMTNRTLGESDPVAELTG